MNVEILNFYLRSHIAHNKKLFRIFTINSNSLKFFSAYMHASTSKNLYMFFFLRIYVTYASKKERSSQEKGGIREEQRKKDCKIE